jgi:hypothetical protein
VHHLTQARLLICPGSVDLALQVSWRVTLSFVRVFHYFLYRASLMGFTFYIFLLPSIHFSFLFILSLRFFPGFPIYRFTDLPIPSGVGPHLFFCGEFVFFSKPGG